MAPLKSYTKWMRPPHGCVHDTWNQKASSRFLSRARPSGWDGLPAESRTQSAKRTTGIANVLHVWQNRLFICVSFPVVVCLFFPADLGPASCSGPASLWSLKEVRVLENIGVALRVALASSASSVTRINVILWGLSPVSRLLRQACYSGWPCSCPSRPLVVLELTRRWRIPPTAGVSFCNRVLTDCLSAGFFFGRMEHLLGLLVCCPVISRSRTFHPSRLAHLPCARCVTTGRLVSPLVLCCVQASDS